MDLSRTWPESTGYFIFAHLFLSRFLHLALGPYRAHRQKSNQRVIAAPGGGTGSG